MEWRPVESSAIRRVGHDTAPRALGVRFQSGETYVYSGVEGAVFEAFLGADAKGRFFGEAVLGCYEFRRSRHG